MITPSSPAPSSAGLRVLRNTLAALEAVPDLKSAFFENIAAADLAISDPIPAYTVGLVEIQAGELSAAAEFASWRYVLSATTPHNPVASADLCFVDAQWVVTGLNGQQLTTALDSALAFAQASSQWKAGGLELRLLHIPALYTMLVWLHGGSNSYVVVMDPENLIKPGTVLDETTLMKTLSDIAAHYEPVKP